MESETNDFKDEIFNIRGCHVMSIPEVLIMMNTNMENKKLKQKPSLSGARADIEKFHQYVKTFSKYKSTPTINNIRVEFQNKDPNEMSDPQWISLWNLSPRNPEEAKKLVKGLDNVSDFQIQKMIDFLEQQKKTDY